jgi:hypothetical protein
MKENDEFEFFYQLMKCKNNFLQATEKKTPPFFLAKWFDCYDNFKHILFSFTFTHVQIHIDICSLFFSFLLIDDELKMVLEDSIDLFDDIFYCQSNIVSIDISYERTIFQTTYSFWSCNEFFQSIDYSSFIK